MTDIESLRQRDKEFSIEEKLVCCVWVHDRVLNGKTFDDIQRDFESRFQKKAPKHDLLIMWERNSFNSGSVNFKDNSHMLGNGVGQRSESPSINKTEAKPHLNEPRNGLKTTMNSIHSLSQQSGQQLKPKLAISSQPLPKRFPPPIYPVHFYPKNFNPSLYKTELCRQYSESGNCDYAEKCLFAHGKHELKQVQNYQNYQTRVCLNWANGHCQYGTNCMFLHPNSQRYSRKDSPGLYDNRTGYYQRAPKMAKIGQY